MVIADGTPLQRYLNFGLVPGLCAKHPSWYEARVEAKGPRLRAWIEDILVADVQDDTYASGRFGLGGIISLGGRRPISVASKWTARRWLPPTGRAWCRRLSTGSAPAP
jgi:hypothetical protein